MNIDAFGPKGLQELCQTLGQPAFRARQLQQWLYLKAVHSYDEMTNLPASLRKELADTCPLTRPGLVTRQISRDGTRKYLLQLADGVMVETVGLPSPGHLTVCFSTQAGCAMNCLFCATGQSGLTRSLTPGEMVWQVLAVAEDFGQRVTNAVAMGQGEPFCNYEATCAALALLNSPDGPNIGARHITVSTCGIIPKLEQFIHIKEQYTLAISLHSAIQTTRDQIMPGVKNHKLQDLRAVIESYIHQTNRRPTFEYALISNINDTEEELDALIRFCKGLLCHVNLIPINSTDATFKQPTEDIIQHFFHTLHESGIETSIRTPRGADIDGACGQLKQRLVNN